MIVFLKIKFKLFVQGSQNFRIYPNSMKKSMIWIHASFIQKKQNI